MLSEAPPNGLSRAGAGPRHHRDDSAEVAVGGARGALSGLWAGPACKGDVAAGFDGCFALSSVGAAARAGPVAAYGLSPQAAAVAAPLHCIAVVSGAWGAAQTVSIRVVCPKGAEVRAERRNGFFTVLILGRPPRASSACSWTVDSA